ncbi:signal peptide peptidase SppA [Geminicoccaceae bacterium 1502E]|nr:signal peptide peptidase SppA [Geminicoccaceae bacterium 1502E]
MRRFIVGLLATIGLLALLAVAGVGFAGWWLWERFTESEALPERIVLELDLREALPEVPDGPSLRSFSLDREPTVAETVLALDAATRDPRVTGVVALLDETSHGFAVTQELRDAIGRFRASGRFALAWADSFGELSSGNEGYYLASAFEEIHLQPVGLVGLSGLSMELPYGRELLASLGVELSVGRRAEYKNALESFTHDGPTEASAEMMAALVDGLHAQMLQGLAEGRGMDAAAMGAIVGGGPYAADDAEELGLVDGLAYRDEVIARARRRAGGAALLTLAEYGAATAGPEQGPAIAVVRAAGPIERGSPGFGTRIGAEDLVRELEGATRDDTVAAIVLRIDSPGGSAVGSETVARAVQRAVQAGKPVVVSMGNAAASGGYWIAMGASRIVAQPATFTGSIGVIAGKPVLAGAWKRLGIEWAAFARGENAGMWSINEAYDAGERERLEHLLDALYGSFKEGVAAGRDMTPERVEELARGRVWLGSKARELGLVDRTGGLLEAIEEARSAAGLPVDAPGAVRLLPAPEWPWQRFLGLLDGDMASLARGALGALGVPLASGPASAVLLPDVR